MTGKKKKNFFSEWAEKLPTTDGDQLPLTHITSAFTARSIIRDGKLVPFDCKRLKKKLVYMFYGAVSYTLPSPTYASKIMDCPVCFVLNGSLIEKATQVYPFDSGAFKDRMFSDEINEKFFLENFDLSDDPNSAAKVIGALYKKRKSYIVGNTKDVNAADNVCGEGEFEVREYIALLLSQAGSNVDKRVSSFEVAFDFEIPLSDWLECVILPDLLISKEPLSPWVKSLVDSNVELLPYSFTMRTSQTILNHLIESQFLQFCERRGYL